MAPLSIPLDNFFCRNLKSLYTVLPPLYKSSFLIPPPYLDALLGISSSLCFLFESEMKRLVLFAKSRLWSFICYDICEEKMDGNEK